MEVQQKNYKGIKGLMPDGKISEKYVNKMVKDLSGTEGAVGLNDTQLRKKIIAELKTSKKLADGESQGSRNKNTYGGMQKAAAKKPMSKGGVSRSTYNKGGYATKGQPMYKHGECPKAKAN